MQFTPLQAALVGVVGGIAVELVLLGRSFHRGRQHVAARYKDWVFWVVRLAIALVSGVVAWLYYNPALHPIIYFHLGAATPALVMEFSIRPPGVTQADRPPDEQD